MKTFKQYNEDYNPNNPNNYPTIEDGIKLSPESPTGDIGEEVIDPYENDMIIQDIKDAIDTIYNAHYDSFNTREEFDDLVKSIL